MIEKLNKLPYNSTKLVMGRLYLVYALNYNLNLKVHHFQSRHHQFFHYKNMNLVDMMENPETKTYGKLRRLVPQNLDRNTHCKHSN